MNLTRQQFQKRVERERRVKKKVLLRRQKMRADAKEVWEKEKMARANQKVINRHNSTIKYSNKEGNMSEEQVMAQLQHNLKILEALEQEHEAAQKAQNHLPQNWGGTAEVVVTPNLPEKDEKKEDFSKENQLV